MRALIIWVWLIMFSFGVLSCNVGFLDLTRGEAVIQEVNGLNVDGPYLSVNNDSKVLRIGDIDDSGSMSTGTTGNNNACLEPGETVGINIGISNTGKKDAYAVNIAVSTADPYVGEMKNTAAYIPFIEHDEYISSYSSRINGILVSVKDTAPHGHKIRIDVDLSDSSGGSWHDYCLLIVY
jgi:hypothetical protein